MAAEAQTPEARAYTDWCLSCKEKPSQAETDRRWLRFLIDSYKATRDPRVFGELIKPALRPGSITTYRYAVHDIDTQTFVVDVKRDFSDIYTSGLSSSGIITSLPQPDYADLETEFYLEVLKAYEPVRALGLKYGDDCEPLVGPAATMFYRYFEVTHALLGLPPVSKLMDSLRTWNERSAEILRSGQFDLYAIENDAERLRLSELISTGTRS